MMHLTRRAERSEGLDAAVGEEGDALRRTSNFIARTSASPLPRRSCQFPLTMPLDGPTEQQLPAGDFLTRFQQLKRLHPDRHRAPLSTVVDLS
jgi:hypothetical protein